MDERIFYRRAMIVISHRGASCYAPENTLTAFKKAIEMGSKAFEFDVHRSADGKLIVHHDYDFSRTAGIKRSISSLKLEEIKKINVAAHFTDARFESAPLLGEVLDLISPVADFINVEIKNDSNIYPGIEKDIIKEVQSRSSIFEKTIFSSFYFPAIEKIREISPRARLGYLGHKLPAILLFPALAKASRVRCENFHLSRKISFSFNLKFIMKFGFKVCVYTVNERIEAERLKEIGVYGIFSNYPDIMEKYEN